MVKRARPAYHPRRIPGDDGVVGHLEIHNARRANYHALDAEAPGDERLAAFFREGQVLQTELAEGAKGLLGIIEPPPEFGANPATGGSETTARGSTPDMPRTPLGDEPPDMGGIR